MLTVANTCITSSLTISLLFKNYSLAEATCLLIRFYNNKTFLWNKEYCDRSERPIFGKISKYRSPFDKGEGEEEGFVGGFPTVISRWWLFIVKPSERPLCVRKDLAFKVQFSNLIPLYNSIIYLWMTFYQLLYQFLPLAPCSFCLYS